MGQWSAIGITLQFLYLLALLIHNQFSLLRCGLCVVVVEVPRHLWDDLFAREVILALVPARVSCAHLPPPYICKGNYLS